MIPIPVFRPPPEHSIRKIDRVVGNSQVQSYLSTPQLNVSTDEGSNTVSKTVSAETTVEDKSAARQSTLLQRAQHHLPV